MSPQPGPLQSLSWLARLDQSTIRVQGQRRGCHLLCNGLIAKRAMQKAGGLALCPSRAREKSNPSSLVFACGFTKVLMPPADEISSDTHLPFFSLYLPHGLVHALLSALTLARPFTEMPYLTDTATPEKMKQTPTLPFLW